MKYFYLQLKRVAKIFPFVLAVTLALLIGLSSILSSILTSFTNSEENQQFKIAITGDTDNQYVELGMAALQALDETRFSVEFVAMPEKSARTALEKGDISAYVVLPKDFIEKALHGEMDPITYVTSAGMEGITTLFKKEITDLVTDMVVYSQKGAYGLAEALDDNGHSHKAQQQLNRLSLDYTDLILKRGELYSLKELGISDGLTTSIYYICAITVILFVLIGLPFAAIHIKKEHTFNRILHARGYSSAKQLGCEYGVHLLSMLLQAGAMLLAIAIFMKLVPSVVTESLFTEVPSAFPFKLIPIIIMLSAFNVMMFEFSNNMVSGLLLHFFVAISLCYVSGCMYPIYAFPKSIQSLAVFSPFSMAHRYLATCFTYDPAGSDLMGMILYAVLFYGIALLLRYRKTTGNGR